jgi:alkanesulfonate monooxygenase SsuD/methylene tetrahydromethanopterin reductase-like flavin-dependent oxidoreductase (luciferase family)
MADLLDEVEIADCLGLDVFGIGEHHRAEFLDSAPAIIWQQRLPVLNSFASQVL